jgi:hypothetical protein
MPSLRGQFKSMLSCKKHNTKHKTKPKQNKTKPKPNRKQNPADPIAKTLPDGSTTTVASRKKSKPKRKHDLEQQTKPNSDTTNTARPNSRQQPNSDRATTKLLLRLTMLALSLLDNEANALVVSLWRLCMVTFAAFYLKASWFAAFYLTAVCLLVLSLALHFSLMVCFSATCLLCLMHAFVFPYFCFLLLCLRLRLFVCNCVWL